MPIEGYFVHTHRTGLYSATTVVRNDSLDFGRGLCYPSFQTTKSKPTVAHKCQPSSKDRPHHTDTTPTPQPHHTTFLYVAWCHICDTNCVCGCSVGAVWCGRSLNEGWHLWATIKACHFSCHCNVGLHKQ